jgi:hypothetical protein
MKKEITMNPAVLEIFTKLQWAAVNYRSEDSVVFADELNVIHDYHKALHIMINHFGGWHQIKKIMIGMDQETFSKKILDIWNNLDFYDEVPHCKGYHELLTGNCKKLLNVYTGKHVFSDGSSLQYEN